MTEDLFLLFEDTKKSHKGVSFSQPVTRLSARKLEDVKGCLKEATLWQKKGYYVAGYIAYEAGWALIEKQSCTPQLPNYPIVDFYVFKDKNTFNAIGEDSEHAHIHNFKNKTSFEKYRNDLETIFAHLHRGDSYQVNYTQRRSFESTADAWTTYQTLRKAQRVEYAAFLSLKDLQILSFSPELFLKKTGTTLKTKPMKGTTARSNDPIEDLNNKEFLLNDEKNRAENVMIVDLLRNDLGRVAVPGSVKVTSLFQLEEYETVFQMTSEIECEVDAQKDFETVIAALFPCGSITGAPKLRTMEIINDLEKEPRGVYTGAIGYLEPNGDFCFNVAIRTLVKGGEPQYTFGSGGGILIDSNIEEEYIESGLKGRFLKAANSHFSLIESIYYDGKTFKYLPDHLARMEKSADYFGFDFSLEDISSQLQKITNQSPARVKLSLWNDHRAQIEFFALDPIPANPEVVVSTARIDAKSIFQRHKTSRRGLYDDQYNKARTLGFYEVLYLNEDEEVAEASRHNIFVKIDGKWFTPPVSSGALPGIERSRTLRDFNALEKALTLDEVKHAQEVVLTNSVRGRVSVKIRDGL